jgi:hypothetical protein
MPALCHRRGPDEEAALTTAPPEAIAAAAETATANGASRPTGAAAADGAAGATGMVATGTDRERNRRNRNRPPKRMAPGSRKSPFTDWKRSACNRLCFPSHQARKVREGSASGGGARGEQTELTSELPEVKHPQTQK